MKQSLLSSLFLFLSNGLYAPVGIGTNEPKAFFHIPVGKTVLFGADTTGMQQGEIAPKMIWYGRKGAFRAGGISNNPNFFNNWDNANSGVYSFASGVDTKASGSNSTAMGYQTSANGNYSTAMGALTTASGYSSTAMGIYTTASGYYSTAIGNTTTSSGYASTALGIETAAIGNYSTALGRGTTASGEASTALGRGTTASGEASTAMGSFVSTNSRSGSFIIGDHNSNIYGNSAENQMMMRFGGGYVFYSGSGDFNSQTAPGAELKANQTSWSVVSDSTRKENFRYSDGTSFLKKISVMRLGSWNYKGQNAKQYRHYGPMAQDFFAAFGHDDLGVIGDDKSINQADFDGVNLIAIQALIKEVEALKEENGLLKNSEATSKDKSALLEKEMVSLKTEMQQFKKQMSVLMNQ